MKYLQNIFFQQSYHPFFAGQNIEFNEGINFVVGDQGAGKSTLLNLIINRPKEVILKISETFENYFYFDTELQNPRINSDVHIKKYLEYIIHHKDVDTAFFEKSKDLSIQFLMDNKNSYRNHSHGEVILPMLEDLKQFENSLILLDEPESSLSLRSQKYLLSILEELEQKGNQVIIATHSKLLLENAKVVLNLNGMRWETGNDYISYLMQ